MSIDIDIPRSLNVESELYAIETKEVATTPSPNSVVGVAKRRFNRDYGTSFCRAKTVTNYNGYVFVLVSEAPYRDCLDGYAIKAIREYPNVVRGYHDGEDDAIELLVDAANDYVVVDEEPAEVEARLERLLEMLA